MTMTLIFLSASDLLAEQWDGGFDRRGWSGRTEHERGSRLAARLGRATGCQRPDLLRQPYRPHYAVGKAILRSQ